MGWFHTRGPSSRPAVSVLAEADGEPAGSGVLLPGRHLLTCAHVVNSALGRPDPLASDHPGPVTVRVRIIARGVTVEREAELTAWIPPRTDDGGLGGYEWNGDLAVLRVTGALPPAFQPPPWHPMVKEQRVRAWHGSGEPGVFADAEVTNCDGRFGYFDGGVRSLDIEESYSGGPLWTNDESAVVGLVTAKLDIRGGPVRRAWGIPWQRVRRELDDRGLAHLAAGPEDGVRDHPAYWELVTLLDGPLPAVDGWARCGRAVARQCGLGHRPDGAPSAEEFARLLLTHERALPALVEAARRTAHELADQLLAVAGRHGLARLLSPHEYKRLVEHIDALPAPAAARVPAAVRAALPLAALPAALFNGGGSHAALVEHLETLHGDIASAPYGGVAVPRLLRAVEYVAAACSRAGGGDTALRQWCDRVAERLGVSETALLDRRRDAADWARKWRLNPPRVLVELRALPSREDGAERYRMRLWCDDGSGPQPVSEQDQRPRTSGEVAREILAVVGPLRRADDSVLPVVELVVDRDSLELPLDDWEDPDQPLPRVLGAEYPVVVNCPELRERGGDGILSDWRERWRRLDSEEPLHIDDEAAESPRALYGLLMERRFAGRANIVASGQRRSAAVQTCLAAGVPVVLWDRGDKPGSPALGHFTDPRGHLPEQVRIYRAMALQRPLTCPGRPVLAWADPALLPPDGAGRPVPEEEPEELVVGGTLSHMATDGPSLVVIEETPSRLRPTWVRLGLESRSLPTEAESLDEPPPPGATGPPSDDVWSDGSADERVVDPWLSVDPEPPPPDTGGPPPNAGRPLPVLELADPTDSDPEDFAW
ncbi:MULTISPECIES: trypsin-like peptidase domain-containing protein [Streptomyces]|uniref:Trypsin-like peptidase domain-containing protein n=1 Tax=Streptomyces lonegramiae TaxID=3075524 RepID=A0ABU2XAQ6_9ACTN|nr:trypsin-like peptidase domain-containing protein [Streptomyces sp. DSM 41529]MDT0543003.1 trypsin-like peptidase domain-containing protein [Streptomyces sp. DSM 41529]